MARFNINTNCQIKYNTYDLFLNSGLVNQSLVERPWLIDNRVSVADVDSTHLESLESQ